MSELYHRSTKMANAFFKKYSKNQPVMPESSNQGFYEFINNESGFFLIKGHSYIGEIGDISVLVRKNRKK